MNLIDTHAHLDQVEDVEAALKRAEEAGVSRVIAVSIDAASSRKNLEIKRNAPNPMVELAMGMHPSDADPGALEECAALIREHRRELVAIGEIGLDFWYKWVRKDKQKKDEQRQVFRTLVELAKELDLPAVIHTRGAWRECFETVKSVGLAKAEFHWYSGPIDVLRDILDHGYYISASPSLVYSDQSREACKFAPIERVMIETDSPVYFRAPLEGSSEGAEEGFRSEPKDVLRTLKAYCKLKNFDETYAAETLNRNAERFFSLC